MCPTVSDKDFCFPLYLIQISASHYIWYRLLCSTIPDLDFCVPLYLIPNTVSHYTWNRFLCPTVPHLDFCAPLYLIQISVSYSTWNRFLCPTVLDIDFCVPLYLIQISWWWKSPLVLTDSIYHIHNQPKYFIVCLHCPPKISLQAVLSVSFKYSVNQ